MCLYVPSVLWIHFGLSITVWIWACEWFCFRVYQRVKRKLTLLYESFAQLTHVNFGVPCITICFFLASTDENYLEQGCLVHMNL